MITDKTETETETETSLTRAPYFAVQDRQMKHARTLVARWASLQVALEWAVDNDRVDAVIVLIKLGAGVAPTAYDLEHAARANFVLLAQILLGAKTTKFSKRDLNRALHAASREGGERNGPALVRQRGVSAGGGY